MDNGNQKMALDVLVYNYILERSDNVTSAIAQKFMPKLQNNLMKTSMQLPELIQASPEFLKQVIDHLVYKYMVQINHQDAEVFRKEFGVLEWCEISRDLRNIVKAAPEFRDITKEVCEQMQEKIYASSDQPICTCKQKKTVSSKERGSFMTLKCSDATKIALTPEKTTSKNTKRSQKVPATTISSSSNLRKSPAKTIVKQSAKTPYKSTPKKYSNTSGESDDDSDYTTTIKVPVSYRNLPESKRKRNHNADKVSRAFNDKGIVDQQERCEKSRYLPNIGIAASQFWDVTNVSASMKGSNDDSSDEHEHTCKQKNAVSSKEREKLMTLKCGYDNTVSTEVTPSVKATSKNTKRPGTTICSSSNLNKSPAKTIEKQSAKSPHRSTTKKCAKIIDESDDDSDYTTAPTPVKMPASYENSTGSKRNEPLLSGKKRNARAAYGREKEAEIDVNNKKVKFDFAECGEEKEKVKVKEKEENKKKVKKNLEF